MEGRNTGSPGHRKAAEYVAEQFERAGARAAGTQGYFQPARFESRVLEEERSSAELIIDGKAEKLALGDEVILLKRGSPGELVETPMVFVGYGLQIPEVEIDDFAGLDLKGKIAVFLNGAPKTVSGPLVSHYRTARERGKALRAAGAIGSASFSNPKYDEMPWSRSALSRFMPSMVIAEPGYDEEAGLRVGVAINPDRLDRFLAGTAYSAAKIFEMANSGQPLPRFPLKASLRTKVAYSRSAATSDNVAGVIPGTDSRLKNEYVVLSAHLDHVGVGRPINGDAIYNGAMDNASGVATLIEIARKLSQKPAKRSVLLVAVTGEEKGLLGSRFFAENPTVQKDNIIANINLDMFLPIVPLKSIVAYGLDESDLGVAFRKVAARHKVEVVADREPHGGGHAHFETTAVTRDCQIKQH